MSGRPRTPSYVFSCMMPALSEIPLCFDQATELVILSRLLDCYDDDDDDDCAQSCLLAKLALML